MKGFKDSNNNFHPIKSYKKVGRKKREPFQVKPDGVKISQGKLIQMQKEAGIRGRRVKSVLEESNLQPDITKKQLKIISMLRKGKSDSAITPLVAELRVMIQRRNKQMFGKTIPSQALVPYVLPKVNQDGSDAFFIDIFDAFRRAEEENLPVIFNNINGDTIEVPNERLQRWFRQLSSN